MTNDPPPPPDNVTLACVFEIAQASINRSLALINDLDNKASQILSVAFVVLGFFFVGFDLQLSTKELKDDEILILGLVGGLGVLLLLVGIVCLIIALQIRSYSTPGIWGTIDFAIKYPKGDDFQKKVAYDYAEIEEENIGPCTTKARAIKLALILLTGALAAGALETALFALFLTS